MTFQFGAYHDDNFAAKKKREYLSIVGTQTYIYTGENDNDKFIAVIFISFSYKLGPIQGLLFGKLND